ncbi:MAG TPA: hypothetical protein VML54_10620 [Candidatus Limnocylindrales bacterium]|nr:hypothetical protein [Candidatus Limnocylindrales bacterium]
MGLVLSVAAALAVPGVARADGPAAVVSPSAGPMIMNLLSPMIPSQEQAFRDSLREPDRPQSGTGRAGKPVITITVGEPCPEGDLYHELSMPRPRPGRTRR